MKRYLPILLVILLFQSVFYNCKKKDEYITTEPYITFSITPTTIEFGKTATLTIWSNVSIDEDIVINISSSDKTIATTDEVLTLKKGTKTISNTINAISIGETTILMGYDNNKYIKNIGEINLTVEAIKNNISHNSL